MSGLAASPIGCMPIVWNNADLTDLAPTVPYDVILDDLARLGFAGCQFGRGFPEGEALRRELASRNLRLAERYWTLAADENGLIGDPDEHLRHGLAHLQSIGGEVLVVALDGGGVRDDWAGRMLTGGPRWPAAAFDRLAELLGAVADEASKGVRVAFHPHAATWIEAPDEVDALTSRLEGSRARLCLDVGHYTVGGGDPVEAIGRHGALIAHIHLKDVDGEVLRRLRAREVAGFSAAIRERIFTELGNGVLDLAGLLRALDGIGYSGWLMVEQDSTWLQPSEAAAIGSRVLRYALREMD
ncbi:MAG: sugar phosphate isomerase/epimerase [Chloroflexi bacterium]|nr:sugar phosphate isomerase/epimerase [Chloroflexota bacterium]